MVEEALLLVQQFAALFVFVTVVILFYVGHRYALRRLAPHLLPLIQHLPWASQATNEPDGERLEGSVSRWSWKACWYLSGLLTGALIGSLVGLATAYFAFGGYELIDSLPIGLRSTERSTGASYDPAGSAAKGIAKMLITYMVLTPFILSSASVGIKVSSAVVSRTQCKQ